MYAGAITCCDVIQNKNQLFWKRRRERFMRSWRSQSPCSRHVRLGSHSRASTGRKTVGVCPRWVSRLGELATLVQIRSHLFVLSRYATGPGGGNTQETVRHYQECSAEIQWTGLLDMSFGSRVNQLLLSQFVLHCISTLLTWMWWLTWQKMVSGCCLTPRTKDSRYWIISAWFHMPATCVEPHPDDRSLWCEESKVEILVSWHSVLWVLPILWNWYGWFMSEVTISLMPITITIATATSVRKKSYQL